MVRREGFRYNEGGTAKGIPFYVDRGIFRIQGAFPVPIRSGRMASPAQTSGVFGKLQQRSLSQMIGDQIYSAISTGKLKPGQQVTENIIVTELGVSRASVREAFRELRVLGILVERRRKTYIMEQPSAEEISEVYALRGVCEGIAAAAAKKTLTEHDYAHFDQLVQRMEAAAQEGAHEDFLDADVAFHELLWEHTRKPYLERVLQSLTHPYFAYLSALMRRSSGVTLRSIARVHRNYVEDLRQYSGRRLQVRIERHFRLLGEYFHPLCQIEDHRTASRAEATAAGGCRPKATAAKASRR